MLNIVTELSKYFMILLMAFYVLHSFIIFRYKTAEDRRSFYISQNVFMFAIYSCGMGVLYIHIREIRYLFIYGIGLVLFMLLLFLYSLLYKGNGRLITNNICMFLSVSLIMLLRLSRDKCEKQLVFMASGFVLYLVLPFLLKRFVDIQKYTNVYGIGGLILLLSVLVFGAVTNGSKLNITVKGITFQPSEIVKLLFVFFMAGMLYQGPSKKKVAAAIAVAVSYVLVLVFSRDLGGALIFFVTGITMLYISTGDYRYFFSGIVFSVPAAAAAYRFFSHVRVRVQAYLDPFSDIDGKGYQITQSLFAIGTGSWFGMGLCNGSPQKIPVAVTDFVFAAVSEEMGCIFSICLVFIYISTFFMMINLSLMVSDMYYSLIAAGFAVMFGFQFFLNTAGVVKLVPLTGVTLPLVSYGGTSLLSTIIMFSVILWIYEFAGMERGK